MMHSVLELLYKTSEGTEGNLILMNSLYLAQQEQKRPDLMFFLHGRVHIFRGTALSPFKTTTEGNLWWPSDAPRHDTHQNTPLWDLLRRVNSCPSESGSHRQSFFAINVQFGDNASSVFLEHSGQRNVSYVGSSNSFTEQISKFVSVFHARKCSAALCCSTYSTTYMHMHSTQ